MIITLLVSMAGGLGAVARLVLDGLIRGRHALEYPVGTTLINVTGSFLLGFVLRYGVETTTLTPEVRAFLTVGFCGGYTTFSTFSYETVALAEDGQWARAVLYIALSVGLSLVATFVGFVAARELILIRGRV